MDEEDEATGSGEQTERPAWGSKEAASNGGKERARRQRLRRDDPDAWAAETFRRSKADLVEELLDAALGRGKWVGVVVVEHTCEGCGAESLVTVDIPSLPPEKRIGALTKSLEYTVGRTQQGKPTGTSEPERPTEPPKRGIELR